MEQKTVCSKSGFFEKLEFFYFFYLLNNIGTPGKLCTCRSKALKQTCECASSVKATGKKLNTLRLGVRSVNGLKINLRKFLILIQRKNFVLQVFKSKVFVFGFNL